jgi:hypothetical protein
MRSRLDERRNDGERQAADSSLERRTGERPTSIDEERRDRRLAQPGYPVLTSEAYYFFFFGFFVSFFIDLPLLISPPW